MITGDQLNQVAIQWLQDTGTADIDAPLQEFALP